METMQHQESTPAFCRQRCRMDGEDELFWLTEAELLARLAENARRLELLQASIAGRTWKAQLGSARFGPTA